MRRKEEEPVQLAGRFSSLFLSGRVANETRGWSSCFDGVDDDDDDDGEEMEEEEEEEGNNK